MVAEWGLWFIKTSYEMFLHKNLAICYSMISLTHFLSHSLTLTSALLCAGGWSRQPPRTLPTKSSSDSNTRGSKKTQFINSLLASQTNSLPHNILTLMLKACKFSYVSPQNFNQSHLQSVQCVSPLFFPVWMDTTTHGSHLLSLNWFTHGHPQHLSLPVTQASIFIIKYY